MNHQYLLGVPEGAENFSWCLWCDYFFCNKKKETTDFTKRSVKWLQLIDILPLEDCGEDQMYQESVILNSLLKFDVG